MNQQDPTSPPPQNSAKPHAGKYVANDLAVMQKGERVVCVIKRHPIGLIINYVLNVLLLVGLAFVVFGLMPQYSDGLNSESANSLGIGIFLIVALLSAAFTLISTVVYWGNTWTVTSDSLTQVNQNGLFSRQSSQLALESIEDVSATQHGIFTHIFNYGLLKVETAGEHSKFHFVFCPNPNYYAREILAAREAFELSGGHHGAASPSNDHQSAPPHSQPPAGYPPTN